MNQLLNKFSNKNKKNFLWMLGGILLLVVLITLIIEQPFNEKNRLSRELDNYIGNAEDLKDFMLISNSKVTINLNENEDSTVTQGILTVKDNYENVHINGKIDFNSKMNSNNNYSTSFEVKKQNNKVYEKNGNAYEDSKINIKEFDELMDEYYIYNTKGGEIQKINKNTSVDKTTDIYEVDFKDIPKELKKNYLNNITELMDKEIKMEDLKVSSAKLISSVNDGKLKSQQVRIALEVSTSNKIVTIGYINEINLSEDEELIRNQFIN